jgi:hypothetical protein
MQKMIEVRDERCINSQRTEKMKSMYNDIQYNRKEMMRRNTIIGCPWLSQLAICPNDEVHVGRWALGRLGQSKREEEPR